MALGPPLTVRERAVLAAVERRLTNPEIASELFISVRTVESHIASLRRKLAAESRGELIAAARELRESSAPVPANPLRGRGRDLAALRELFARHPWVTIVGPGGVGKTRLALEFARADAGRTPIVVELEHAEPDGIAARMARVLGIEGTAGDDLIESIALALGAQDGVLVLDNADRVGPATATIVATLRAREPRLRVVVTSRTALGSADEAIHPLAPLDTSGPDAPATALLLDRLTANGRALDEQERAVADRITARLDGLPLAIELAASVARHVPLRQLASRLEQDFVTLDRASPDGRHRTLETTFAWTWHLLTDEEQEVLRRLAALPRTFDFELAAAVAHPGAEGTVLRLLDHSLIVPVGGDPVRFRLLAVMREFVHARTDPALIREVRERHAEAVAESAADFISRARTDSSPEALEQSALLCPEVNAALRWSLAARHPTAASLAGSLAVGVEQYGADVDSVGGLALAAEDDWLLGSVTPQQMLSIGSAVAFYDVDLMSALAERALSDASTPDATRAAHQLAGFAAAYRSDRDTALAHLDEAERLALELDQDWELGAIRQARGIALRGPEPEDLARSLEAFESAIRAYTRAGDRVHVSNVRYMMASGAAESLDPADHARARVWADECRESAEAMGNVHELAHARLVLAMLGPRAHDDAMDEVDLVDLADTFRDLGDLRCLNRTTLLRADASERPDERIALLRDALGSADAAADPGRQTATLERLIAAHHAAADQPATLAALARLERIAGSEKATAVCPPELLPAFRAESAAS